MKTIEERLVESKRQALVSSYKGFSRSGTFPVSKSSLKRQGERLMEDKGVDTLRQAKWEVEGVVENLLLNGDREEGDETEKGEAYCPMYW